MKYKRLYQLDLLNVVYNELFVASGTYFQTISKYFDVENGKYIPYENNTINIGLLDKSKKLSEILFSHIDKDITNREFVSELRTNDCKIRIIKEEPTDNFWKVFIYDSYFGFLKPTKEYIDFMHKNKGKYNVWSLHIDNEILYSNKCYEKLKLFERSFSLDLLKFKCDVALDLNWNAVHELYKCYTNEYVTNSTMNVYTCIGESEPLAVCGKVHYDFILNNKVLDMDSIVYDTDLHSRGTRRNPLKTKSLYFSDGRVKKNIKGGYVENASFVWRTYDKTEELKMKTQNIKEKVDENYIEKAYITEKYNSKGYRNIYRMELSFKHPSNIKEYTNNFTCIDGGDCTIEYLFDHLNNSDVLKHIYNETLNHIVRISITDTCRKVHSVNIMEFLERNKINKCKYSKSKKKPNPTI